MGGLLFVGGGYIAVLHVKNSAIAPARESILALQVDFPFARGRVRVPWDLVGAWVNRLPLRMMLIHCVALGWM